jgi:peptidoglycan/xylan/chitin deacetylase (PgdA/CDA1 family)
VTPPPSSRPLPYDAGVEPRGRVSDGERPGALVISLDFELWWGMRDHAERDSAAFADLAPSRQVVADLAGLFDRRGIRATWATVGFLFASTEKELTRFLPEKRPGYRQVELDPYAESVGQDEKADPERLAGSLVELLEATPGQEVASHTFSHFYCLEDGQDEAGLRADLASAQAIAGARGITLTSLVLPRNQWNPAYAKAVRDSGFDCIRGPQQSWAHRARRSGEHGPLLRAARLADSYGGVTPPPTTSWSAVAGQGGLADVPASAFLRPYNPKLRHLEPLRKARLVAGLRDAARRHRIFHLWWHPHNFARYPGANFAFLQGLFDEFDRLVEEEGMQSCSMRDIAQSVVTASAS